MNQVEGNGPIESFRWGSYRITGRDFGKDVRVVGPVATKWKEREGHCLRPEMITGIDGAEIDILLIGIGAEGRLECPDSVRDAVRSLGIDELRLLRTPEACREYNRLYLSGRRVAMLAHGTC